MGSCSLGATNQQTPEITDSRQLLLWSILPQSHVEAHPQRQVGLGPVPHGLRIGDAVAVFALGSSGPLIEGIGIIESYAAGRDYYYIKFVGERVSRLRFVSPDWRADPERSLALLREFWRSCRTDDPRVEDFFPEENN